MYLKIFKNIFDISFAIILFIIAIPVFFICIIGLYLFNNGEVFFVQKRPGKDAKIFEILKFKTMKDLYDKNGILLPDEDRLTALGKFIRKTSLDELPQLLNVLKGEMSFVGPRPLLVEYLPLYSNEQKKRHWVKPGITGWAQVNGRNAISWNKKFEYDVWYVENLTFYLDCKILYLTIAKVFRSEDISSETSVTMEKFNGK